MQYKYYSFKKKAIICTTTVSIFTSKKKIAFFKHTHTHIRPVKYMYISILWRLYIKVILS